MPSIRNLSELHHYTEYAHSFVELMLGEAKRPSSPFEMISVETTSAPSMYMGNPPLKQAYYYIYLDAQCGAQGG